MRCRSMFCSSLILGAFLLTSQAFAQVEAEPMTASITDEATQPRVAAVELRNRSETFLPRVGSYSETALIEHFRGFSEAQFLDRTTVSDMLLRRYDRVVLFPGSPELAAEFGQDLGVDYVITGNILDYETDDAAHRMMVEFVVIDVVDQSYLMRKVYDGEYSDSTPTKRHREILDEIIENMALDFRDLIRVPRHEG